MRVSVSTLAGVTAIAAVGVAGGQFTAAQAGDAVLQVFASPLVIDQANFVSNVAGFSSVETIELQSIAALQRLCAAANDGIPSVAVVGTKITANCFIPDDHIDPRRSALFMARSVLRNIRERCANACSTS